MDGGLWWEWSDWGSNLHESERKPLAVALLELQELFLMLLILHSLNDLRRNNGNKGQYSSIRGSFWRQSTYGTHGRTDGPNLILDGNEK